ncbi:MAG: glycosyltransferase family 4 protein [Patescibacteria group bacterium]
MSDPRCTLITLDYPPSKGGVARYLSQLVEAAHGSVRVVVAQKEGEPMPRWWSLVATCWRERSQSKTILVSHVFPVGTAAWIAQILGGPKYVIILHGLDVRRATSWSKRWLLKQICWGAKAVIANSESTKSDLKTKVSNIECRVVTPGVIDEGYPSREEARRKLSIDTTTELVVSVCRLVPRKGIDFSLRALSRLQTKRNVMYLVVGNGADAERLVTVAQDVRARVTWIRNASDDDVKSWLAAADVFLLPVREDTTDVEGFGIVYLEAALAGIPSVAGKSGGAREAVVHERTGLLVNPNRIEEITEAVEKLLLDPELRKQLGEQGRERARQEFGWKARWEALEGLLC